MAGIIFWRFFITCKTNKGLRPAKGISSKVGSCSFGMGLVTKYLFWRLWWIKSFEDNKVKLKFTKWWMYFIPSLRRWLRDCQKYMNSEEVNRQRKKINIEDIYLNSKLCLVVGEDSVEELHPNWGKKDNFISAS